MWWTTNLLSRYRALEKFCIAQSWMLSLCTLQSWIVYSKVAATQNFCSNPVAFLSIVDLKEIWARTLLVTKQIHCYCNVFINEHVYSQETEYIKILKVIILIISSDLFYFTRSTITRLHSWHSSHITHQTLCHFMWNGITRLMSCKVKGLNF